MFSGSKGFGRWTGLIGTLVLAPCMMASTASASGPTTKPAYWHPWFEIGGYHNSRADDDSTGAGGSTNRGETTVFAPIRGSKRTLLFGQLTAKFFDDSAKEGNFALGYRQMMLSGFNMGTWIGADVRKSAIDNTFWQLSGGFEALSENIDFRVNWYGPTTAPKQGVAGFAQVQLQGNQLLMTGGEEVAMMGVDGEIGFRLPTEYLRLDPKIFELRAYGGGYYFDHADAAQDVAGVKGRIEFRVNDIIASLPGSRLTAEYEVTHDDVRDTRHDVGLRVRIPFGGKSTPALASLTGQQRRMLDGIERDTDIITGASKAEPVEDALTGTDLDRTVFANNTTDVTTVSNAAGDNSHIIVNGDVEDRQTLQGNQTLQGGGSTINVRGRKSGLVLPFTAPGALGHLKLPGDRYEERSDNLTLTGSNTHVAGISITGQRQDIGDGNSAVAVGDDKRNIFLTNLDIDDTASRSIDIANNNQITIINLRSSNAGGNVIGADDNNQITIINPDLRGFETDGIDLDNNNQLTVIGGVFAGGDDSNQGIDMDDDNVVVVTGTSFSDLGGAGIRVRTGESSGFRNKLIISGVTITNANQGIVLADAAPGNGNTATVTNSTIVGIREEALVIGNNATSSISGSRIEGAVDNGHAVNVGSNVSLFFAGNTLLGLPDNQEFISFNGANTEVQSGSIGNINNLEPGIDVCEISGGGSFTGEIGFVDGTVINQADCQ